MSNIYNITNRYGLKIDDISDINKVKIPIKLLNKNNNKHVEVEALYDTGATAMGIPKKIAKFLSLQGNGPEPLKTASSKRKPEMRETYLVDVEILEKTFVDCRAVETGNKKDTLVILGWNVIKLCHTEIKNNKFKFCVPENIT